MSPDAICDEFSPQPTTNQVERFRGICWTIRSDTVELQNGESVVRDLIVHPGAVGIVAIDDQDRILLNKQYRHPVGSYLWEPPAGLMDLPGESPLDCAKREFAEEAGLVAGSWNVLVDFFNSPGGTTEAFRCYLARDISNLEGGRPLGEAEEAGLEPFWLDLDAAVQLVLSGRLGNPTAVAGILAAHTAQQSGWAHLRPGDAPWSIREDLILTDRVRLD
jgi:8-oxo-dGTP pyrophosphatase MutT (NUDIX family)